MADIATVQNSSNSASGMNATVRDGNSQRNRNHIDSTQSLRTYDGIRVTAKYSNPERDTGLRTVKGEERRAIETADTNALVAMQSRRAAAEALMSLQEVGQNSLDQQNTPEVANGEESATRGAEAAGGGRQSSFTETTEINTVGKQPDLTSSGDNNSSNGTAEITLPNGKTNMGSSGAPPRGSVLDIIA